MSQDFAIGNQHGHEDGRGGDNRLAARAARRLLDLGSYLPGAENRDDEYRRGYLAGFEDEVRVQRVTPAAPGTPRPTGAAAMSNATSFAHQIELLQSLRHYLSEFQERLQGVSANYQRKVDALHAEGGLMDETYRDLVEQQVSETRALIERLVEHIGANDIPAVQREIGYLEQKL
ncbi:hypothetical protein [uncultured Thiodictyon sp.]|uniref:hypothetical protein n=1 Tax=uncultured Thiodictyon sp. TaxID=1846217 RepID=UPI0025F18F38|nr:hypothetical protein [uncultured Thiodictyon sp.]